MHFPFGIVAALLLAAARRTSAQGLLGDIASFLSSLGPAPADDPRFTQFQAPGPDDVRSPCPALNALANHNFIHHDGRNMTLPHLIQGLSAGLNVGPDFTVAIGGAALLLSPSPLSGSFDLANLSTHNFPIEHDASISRQDAHFGTPTPFVPASWAQYMAFFEGKTVMDVPTAAAAKFARYNDSLARNPAFTYGAKEALLSYGENALFLQAMGDAVSGNAQVSYVRSLFEEEKLPYALGWRPSAEPITLATVGAMTVRLQSESPEPGAEVVKVAADSYKDILVSIVGGSSDLARITEGISSALGL